MRHVLLQVVVVDAKQLLPLVPDICHSKRVNRVNGALASRMTGRACWLPEERQFRLIVVLVVGRGQLDPVVGKWTIERGDLAPTAVVPLEVIGNCGANEWSIGKESVIGRTGQPD